MSEPNYKCPVCGTLSQLIISAVQAFCTNDQGCKVLSFNPSTPDGGRGDAQEVDLSGLLGEPPESL